MSEAVAVALLGIALAIPCAGCRWGLEHEREVDGVEAGHTADRAPAPDSPTIRLTITGAPGTSFTGECVVEDAAGDERALHFDDEPPVEREIVGSGIACTFTQTGDTGRLSVELQKAGNTARSRTSGRDSTIRIRMR